MLVPMYFLIGVWGSDRRLYAAIKFFLYTLAGSVLMLLAILAHLLSRAHVVGIGVYFESPTLLGAVSQFSTDSSGCSGASSSPSPSRCPMFPFHTWLPDAHTEAPTAGSVILAGVLLKMGTYGFMRFSVPMFAGRCAGGSTSRYHDGAFDRRHHLRRAGLHDAEGHEEAHRLLAR